jgi:hypothetical protein
MKHLLLALSLGFVTLVQAGPITYLFVVDTPGIAGQAGNLDFQFNPGDPTSQQAFASISGFTSNGILGNTDVLSGDVTPNNALLPANFTLGNSTQFNDLFQTFTFGTSLQFQVTLSGPALSTPNGTATAGSTFFFSLYNAAGDTPLLSADPSGAVGTIDANLNGSTTPAILSASVRTITAVPEPASFLLLGFGAAILLLKRSHGLRP